MEILFENKLSSGVLLTVDVVLVIMIAAVLLTGVFLFQHMNTLKEERKLITDRGDLFTASFHERQRNLFLDMKPAVEQKTLEEDIVEMQAKIDAYNAGKEGDEQERMQKLFQSMKPPTTI